MIEIILFFLASSAVNSFGDALKFSGATSSLKIDVLWHVIKYFIQIPFWMISGYYFGTYTTANHYWDFWHPESYHLYIILLITACVILWQMVYFITKTKLSK